MIVYAVQRYLGIGKDTWDGLSWDVQETYLDGLSEDPEVPFSINRDGGHEAWPGQETAAETGTQAGPRHRTGVDAGTDVIDISAMRAELEANPEARRRK